MFIYYFLCDKINYSKRIKIEEEKKWDLLKNGYQYEIIEIKS